MRESVMRKIPFTLILGQKKWKITQFCIVSMEVKKRLQLIKKSL